MKHKTTIIDVAPDGTSRWIHDDKLRGMLDLPGQTTIRRASHVEPGDPGKGQDPIKWYADMAPSNGPVLGPFDTRGEAVDEEVRWLSKHLLGSSADGHQAVDVKTQSAADNAAGQPATPA